MSTEMNQNQCAIDVDGNPIWDVQDRLFEVARAARLYGEEILSDPEYKQRHQEFVTALSKWLKAEQTQRASEGSEPLVLDLSA